MNVGVVLCYTWLGFSRFDSHMHFFSVVLEDGAAIFEFDVDRTIWTHPAFLCDISVESSGRMLSLTPDQKSVQ